MAQPAEGGSMKLWLKGISGSWCETAGGTRSSTELYRKPLFLPAPHSQRLLTCHPGKLVAAEGTTGQHRAQAGHCPPDLQLHPGHSSSISCWPESIGWSVPKAPGGGSVGAGEKVRTILVPGLL